jgi:hypothetical protein
LIGKITTVSGKRDDLIAILLEGEPDAGVPELYHRARLN